MSITLQKSRVSTLCVYKDVSGLFTVVPRQEHEENVSSSSAPAPAVNFADVIRMNPE